MDVLYPKMYVIRTRQGVYLEKIVMFTVVLVTVVIEYVRAQRGVGSGAVPGFNWFSVIVAMFIPMIGTIKVLRHLETLERTTTEPTATMTFLFHVAAMMPIVGYLPMQILSQ